MSKITLTGIANVIKEELKPVNEKLAENSKILSNHTAILNTHTTSLQMLLSKKKVKDDNKTTETFRFDRLEKWAKLVGQKIGVKLEL